MNNEIKLRKGLLEVYNVQEISSNNYKKGQTEALTSKKPLLSFNDVAAAVLNSKQKLDENNKFYIDTSSFESSRKNIPLKNQAAPVGGIRVLSKTGEGEIRESIPHIPFISEKEKHCQYYPLSSDIKEYSINDKGEVVKTNHLDLSVTGDYFKNIFNGNPISIDNSVAVKRNFITSNSSKKFKNYLVINNNKEISLINNEIGVAFRSAGNILKAKNCILLYLPGNEGEIVIKDIELLANKNYTISGYLKGDSISQIKMCLVNSGKSWDEASAVTFNLNKSWNYRYFSKNISTAGNYDLHIKLLRLPAVSTYASITDEQLKNTQELIKIAGLYMEEGSEPSPFDFRYANYLGKEAPETIHPLMFNLPIENSLSWLITYKRKISLNNSGLSYPTEILEDHVDSLGPIYWGYRNGVPFAAIKENGTFNKIEPKASTNLLSNIKQPEDIWETVAITLNKVGTEIVDKNFILNIKIFNDPAESIETTKVLEYEIPIDNTVTPIAELLTKNFEGISYNLSLGSIFIQNEDNSFEIQTYNGMYKDLYYLDLKALSNPNILHTLLSIDLEKDANNPIFRIENIKEK